MAIERHHSVGTHSHRAAHASHGAGSKTSSQPTDTDAASGGFLALLGALDTGSAAASAGDQALNEGPPDLGLPAGLATDPLLGVANAAALAGGSDGAASLAGAADAAAAALAAASAVQSTAQQMTARAGGTATSAIERGARANGGGFGAPGGPAGAGGQAAGSSSKTAATQPPDAAAAVRLGEYASVFEQLQNRLAGKNAADMGPDRVLATDATGGATNGAAASAKAANAKATSAAGVASEARVDRVDRTAALMAGLASVKAETQAASGSAAEATTRTTPSSAPAAAGDAGPIWLNRDFTPTVQYDSTITLDPAQAAPEVQVADQVSYWVSQGVRNAELTIGGGDGADPVQVSIALSGNEAHVEFRTEQASVREMLANSVDHLKESLRSEGMLLSGVSVGASGADASGQGGDRSRSGAAARAATTGRGETGVTEPIAAAATSAARRSAGAIDLFV